MNDSLPEYRPRGISGQYQAPTIPKEHCETLVARWLFRAQRIHSAVAVFAAADTAPSVIEPLLGVARAHEEAAKELSAVIQGLAPPPAGSEWPETKEEM